jgi:hypothetical protein
MIIVSFSIVIIVVYLIGVITSGYFKKSSRDLEIENAVLRHNLAKTKEALQASYKKLRHEQRFREGGVFLTKEQYKALMQNTASEEGLWGWLPEKESE